MIRLNSAKVAIVSFVVMLVAFGLFFWLKDPGLKLADGESALLRLEPQNEPKVNQPYMVKVMVSSPSEPINSVGIYLRFDPQKLKVMEFDTLKSFCQLYPEKKFDNQLGSISLACGAPHPGAKGEIELMSITFMPLVEASSQILVDSGSALLKSDGKGTNLLKDYPVLEVSPGVSF